VGRIRRAALNNSVVLGLALWWGGTTLPYLNSSSSSSKLFHEAAETTGSCCDRPWKGMQQQEGEVPAVSV
jgi:hypothetical protein